MAFKAFREVTRIAKRESGLLKEKKRFFSVSSFLNKVFFIMGVMPSLLKRTKDVRIEV